MTVLLLMGVVLATSQVAQGALLEVGADQYLEPSPGWAVTVSQDGAVEVQDNLHPHKGGRYQLSKRALVALMGLLDRERPWEISGDLGEMMIDGPIRNVHVHYGGRHGFFRLFTTPKEFASVYERDPGSLARALRVCEAARKLVRDETVLRCVDGR